MNTYELTIYTNNIVYEFHVKETCDNFEESILKGLEHNALVFETCENTKIVLNATNFVAIEIKLVNDYKISPPVLK